MLGKLIKYEYKATMRTFIPLYIAVNRISGAHYDAFACACLMLLFSRPLHSIIDRLEMR